MVKVCVLFGGVSSEHEVSLRSAECVLNNIDKNLYEVLMVGITRAGRWYYYTGPVEDIVSGRWEFSPHVRPAMISLDRTNPGLILLGEQSSASVKLRRGILTVGGSKQEKPPQFGKSKILPVDVIFPVLHGKNGEDGTVQGMLELAGIPYVGGGVLSSAMCMDKEISHIILKSAGIPKTKLVAVRKQDFNFSSEPEIIYNLEAQIEYPMFVKPANAGSSVGVSKAKDRNSLKEALDFAFEHDKKAVVEKAVIGKEVECAVLGGKNVIASNNLGEIEPTHEFYDYSGKYLDDSTNLHIPARIGSTAAQNVKALAIKAYKALECKGLARVDFFVKEDGEAILNEINTMPGFTSISMYPRLFADSGISIKELITKLIDCAFED